MKHRTLLILSIAVLAIATGLAAQTPAEPQATTPQTAAQTSSGRVISSTPTAIVIEDASGTRTSYIIDADSTVATGVASGSQVTIEFHPLEGGKFHAARVTVLPAEPVTQPAPTQAVPPSTTTSTTTTRSTEPVGTTTTAGGTTGRTRMPATASPLPLVGLIGLASLAGSLAVRALRRR